MKKNMRILSLAAVVTVAGCSVKEAPKSADSTAAAGAPAATRAAAPSHVNVVATDYKFDAPAEVSAGMVTFSLTNSGKEIHHVSLIKLDSARTMDDLMAGMKAMKPGAAPPGWMIPAGGPNAAAPGNTTNLTMSLEAGNYVLFCFVPDAKGVPHFMHGMAKALTVIPSTVAESPDPDADVTLTLSDYKFDFSKVLDSGHHTIKIEVAAGQPHEFTLFQLAPGKTAADVVKFVEGGMKGTPPGMPVGGVSGLASGRVAFFDVDLKPGNYAAVCFLSDMKDGKPHFVHGMTQTIKII